jgi:RNA-binding protein
VEKLKGFQKKHLRGIAHGMKPVVFIGQNGITAAVSQAIHEALETHELIKVKFIDFKEKDQKKAIAEAIEQKNHCEMAGMIGHMAIFYRQNKDPEKRKIIIPER